MIILCRRYYYYSCFTGKKTDIENEQTVAKPGTEPRKCGPGAHISNYYLIIDSFTVFSFRLISAHP